MAKTGFELGSAFSQKMCGFCPQESSCRDRICKPLLIKAELKTQSKVCPLSEQCSLLLWSLRPWLCTHGLQEIIPPLTWPAKHSQAYASARWTMNPFHSVTRWHQQPSHTNLEIHSYVNHTPQSTCCQERGLGVSHPLKTSFPGSVVNMPEALDTSLKSRGGGGKTS